MTVSKTYHNELKTLENYLDVDFVPLEGSQLYTDLEGIYEELDSEISDLKDKIEDLEKEKEQLESRLEELE